MHACHPSAVMAHSTVSKFAVLLQACKGTPSSLTSKGSRNVACMSSAAAGVPELCVLVCRYMEADLKERIQSGNLPKEVAEEALRDLKENPVTEEAWRDMQRLLKTFLKVDHPEATVFDRRHWEE